MLKSDRKRNLRSNGTVLDAVPVAQLIGVIGTLLVGLFTLIKPEASNGLSLIPRLMFWTLHVGLGLAALLLASMWLKNGTQLPESKISSIAITGFAAALFASPGYVLLDAVFASSIIDLDTDAVSDNVFFLVISEVMDLLPFFLLTWLLMNLPLLINNPAEPDAPVKTTVDAKDATKSPGNETPANNTGNTGKNATEHKTSAPEESGGNMSDFLDSIPGFIGTDIIAVSSDLHYLNVWTAQGRATVLGNLRDAVSELGDIGMQIHRSHWVASKHVERVVGNTNNGECILSNDLRIPISRRKYKEVRQYFGHGVVSRSTIKNPDT